MEGAADPVTYDHHHCGRSHRDPLTEVLVAVNRPALTQFQQEAELLLRESQSSWFPRNGRRTGFRLKFRSDSQKTGPKLRAHLATSRPTCARLCPPVPTCASEAHVLCPRPAPAKPTCASQIPLGSSPSDSEGGPLGP